MSYEKFIEHAVSYVDQKNRWVITIDGVVCGTVSYYFEDEQNRWL